MIIIVLLLSLYWPTIQNGEVLGDIAPKPIPPGEYLVTDTHDGDTISVLMNGQKERVRLIGIDTPETHAPGKPVQCYGAEASRETEKLRDQTVRLEADPVGDDRDRYDRLLRYVYHEGKLWNQHLVEDGYAFAYTLFPFGKREQFVSAHESARISKHGLWGACQPYEKKSKWYTEPAIKPEG